MFEEQSPASSNDNNIASGQNQNKTAEDIFANTDTGSAPIPLTQNQSVQAPTTVSSLAGQQTTSALTSGKINPVQSQAGGVPKAQVSGANKAGFSFKKIIIIIFIIIVIFGIVGAVFFVFQSKVRSKIQESVLEQHQNSKSSESESPALDNSSASKDNSNTEENITQDAEQDQNKDKGQNDNILENFIQIQQDKVLNPIAEDLASKDTDQDGLSDAKEFDLGTNYRLVDSDNDGLSDLEEVSVFGTDPLDKDSDKDSYLDGEEVQNGYNPMGPGKLLNFEKAQ